MAQLSTGAEDIAPAALPDKRVETGAAQNLLE
jgi:hypothetical protein